MKSDLTNNASINFIYDKVTYNKFKKDIETFEILYNNNFTDQNEKEDFKGIISRIINNDTSSTFRTFICIDRSSSGVVLEYYVRSNCLLITYIAVSEPNRRKGLAKQLIESGLKLTSQYINSVYGKKTDAVFFEANNPISTVSDSFDPNLRLEIFRKSGCKWIDIEYVQPPLDKQKHKVFNLLLFCYPINHESGTKLKKTTIISFLEDFYYALNIQSNTDDYYKKMILQINGNSQDEYFYLKNIPYTEKPKLQFSRCSVSIHVPYENKVFQNGECHFLGSFEDDLLSYYYQKHKPFNTILNNPDSNIKCTIIFPEFLRYYTEGRAETVYTKNPAIEVLISVTDTSFISKKSVFTLTIKPSDYFNEYELIKLISLFGTKQEKTNLIELVRFRISDTILTFKDFLRHIKNDQNIELSKNFIITGSTILDLIYIRNYDTNCISIDFDKIIKSLHGIHLNDHESYSVLNNLYNNDPLNNYVLNLFCGLTLGIFDFERMGWDEFTDTVSPILSSYNSSIILNRSNILNLCLNDNLLASTYEKFGSNPYIILPNIIITYNEFVISQCSSLLNTAILSDSFKVIDIEKTLETVTRDQSYIYENVFNYETEKILYDNLIISRNINIQKLNLLNKETELKNKSKQMLIFKRDRVDALITVVLICITILQLESNFLRSVVGIIIHSNEISSIDRIQVSVILSLILLSVLFYRIIRKNSK